MRLINKDTDYAVRALCAIAAKNQTANISDLVLDLKISRSFLRKILQILAAKKILKSVKGKNGGFSLQVPASEIYLLNLIQIFQGPIQLNHCRIKSNACPEMGHCKMRQAVQMIEKTAEDQLSHITISYLMKS